LVPDYKEKGTGVVQCTHDQGTQFIVSAFIGKIRDNPSTSFGRGKSGGGRIKAGRKDNFHISKGKSRRASGWNIGVSKMAMDLYYRARKGGKRTCTKSKEEGRVHRLGQRHPVLRGKKHFVREKIGRKKTWQTGKEKVPLEKDDPISKSESRDMAPSAPITRENKLAVLEKPGSHAMGEPRRGERKTLLTTRLLLGGEYGPDKMRRSSPANIF